MIGAVVARIKKPKQKAKNWTLVRCDGCRTIQQQPGRIAGEFHTPCPFCGSDTATYAYPLT